MTSVNHAFRRFGSLSNPRGSAIPGPNHWAILATAIAAVTLVGCPDGPIAEQQGFLTINLTQGEGFRAILPSYDMAIAFYAVTVEKAGSTTVAFVDRPAAQAQISDVSLQAGTWRLRVTAKNATRAIIGSGEATATVIAGAHTEASVLVVQLPGNGSLLLAASWPAEMSLLHPSIVGTLSPKGSSAAPIQLAFPAIGGNDLASNLQRDDIPTGLYSLALFFKDGKDIVAARTVDSVQVAQGRTSSGDIAFSIQPGYWGTAEVTIVTDLQNPIGVVFTGQESVLVQGETMTIDATTAEAGTTFEWYLDGEVIPETATGRLALSGADLSLDRHRIDLFVSAGSKSSSATLFVDVVSTLDPLPDPDFSSEPNMQRAMPTGDAYDS
jgi:hypothetical protein